MVSLCPDLPEMPLEILDNMDIELHSQKLAILSRLIKESSLTLEEALLLLKQEELPITSAPFVQPFNQPFTQPTPYTGDPFRTWVTTSGSSTAYYDNKNGTITFQNIVDQTLTN